MDEGEEAEEEEEEDIIIVGPCAGGRPPTGARPRPWLILLSVFVATAVGEHMALHSEQMLTKALRRGILRLQIRHCHVGLAARCCFRGSNSLTFCNCSCVGVSTVMGDGVCLPEPPEDERVEQREVEEEGEVGEGGPGSKGSTPPLSLLGADFNTAGRRIAADEAMGTKCS